MMMSPVMKNVAVGITELIMLVHASIMNDRSLSKNDPKSRLMNIEVENTSIE
jgi:hypothetical protein